MSKKSIAIIVAIIVIGAGAAALSSNKNDSTATDNNQQQADNNAPQNTETQPAVKEFTVGGNNFKFDPAEIRINKGDTVRITLKNTGGFHDLLIDEFNVATQRLQDGQEETVEFVADKSGTFEYYCSVGQHRTMGMTGKLIVEE